MFTPDLYGDISLVIMVYFFVWRNCTLRFWEISCLCLIRWFPRSFLISIDLFTLFTVPDFGDTRRSYKYIISRMAANLYMTVCNQSSLERRSRVRFRSNPPRNDWSYGARMGNHLLNIHTTAVPSNGTCWSDTAHSERSRDLPRGWIQLTTE